MAACVSSTMAAEKDIQAREAKIADAQNLGFAKVMLKGSVLEISAADRTLVMVDSFGNRNTLKVDPSVTSFDKVAAGDTVQVDYFITGRAEIREATADEKKQPLTVLESSELADNPFGKHVKLYKIVTTIENMDRSKAILTIKSAQGHSVKVQVKDTDAFNHYKPGDTAVITYTEPIVAKLEKAGK